MSIPDLPWPSTGSTATHAQLLGYRTALAARLLSKDFNRRTAPLGVTAGQWPLLVALSAGPCTQSALAQRLALEQPTVANTLRRLERDGLIERAPVPTDRRSSSIRLSDKGRRLLPSVARRADEVNAGAVAGLTADEGAALEDLLQRVIENLAATVSAVAPSDQRASPAHPE